MDNFGIFGIYNSMGPAGVAAFLFWAIASITLHELAHGWAAIWQGDDTPRIYNRMTWNPIVHMGWTSIILLCIAGIAWGVMPTNPGSYRWGRRGRIVVSGAGPAMNVLIGLICWSAVGIIVAKGLVTRDVPDSPWHRVLDFAFIGATLNGMLALFNMLPIPPFDGASVLAGFSRTFYRWMHDPRVANIGFFVVIVALVSGISSILSNYANNAGMAWAAFVGGLVSGGSSTLGG